MPVRRNPNHIPAADPKQGIVTILSADCDKNTKTGSIRRTLSADMSSKKWLQNNGFFSPIKKIVSSHQIADHHSDSDDDEFKSNQSPNQDEIWKSIQAEKEKNEKNEKPAGVWGLILTQKSDNSLLQHQIQLPTQPPYIHPMVKRSRSSLSEKSLEVCTESLGSETGSDCFSCHSSDEEEDRVENLQSHEMMMQREEDPFADLQIPKYKKSPAKPFPPPLPSIAGASGSSLYMHSRRENGRLVVEAVSMAPKKYFHAQRHDGRLLLTLNHSPTKNLEYEESESEPLVEEQNLSLPTRMHKSGLVVKKLMVVGNINPKWANARPPVARPPPPVSAFNAYEYFWRSKPGFMMSNKNSKMNQDLVRYMRGCKEARRSLIWEPYCIATS